MAGSNLITHRTLLFAKNLIIRRANRSGEGVGGEKDKITSDSIVMAFIIRGKASLKNSLLKLG